METLPCPTCSSMVLVLIEGEHRCPMCYTHFGSGTPVAPSSAPMTIDVPEESIRDVRTSVDPPLARVVPVPEPPAAPAASPALARTLVHERPEPAPVEAIHAVPPEPAKPRVRWWDRLPLRWTIEFVERPMPEPEAPEPTPRPEPRVVAAPDPPAPPPARARVAPEPAPEPPRPAPKPREPNPMWRDRVFRGTPDDAQLVSVTWPRRSHA